MVNHGSIAVLFYNNTVNNLCLAHKSVSPATALSTVASQRLKKSLPFTSKNILSILALPSV